MASLPPLRRQAAPALFQLLSDSSLSRAALNGCGVPIALLEADGSSHFISYVNAAFAAYLGFAESEALGRSLATLLLRGDEALLRRMIAESPARWPITVWHKSGAAQPVELAFGVVLDADGRQTHWVLTFSDRGEVERLRAEVESLKALAGAPYLRLDAPAQPARASRPSSAETPTDRPAS